MSSFFSRASSQQQSMDEDPRLLPGGSRRVGGEGPGREARPAVPDREPIRGTALASVHRPPPPTPPARSPARPPRQIITPSINSRPPAPTPRERDGIMGLQDVRNGPRQQNEYVESPRLGLVKPSSYPDREVITSLLPTRDLSPNTGGSPGIITNQPQPSGLKAKKDHPTNTNKGHRNSLAPDPLIRGHHTDDEPHDSIICSKCRKCKCSACTSPRKLPSRWLCNGRCNCSADTVVDYCSCLCCVQFVFYHYANSENDPAVSDRPCACFEVPHCCKRWTCMGLMSTCLPCLCLYWPLRGLVGLSKVCYNGCSRRGCQCHRDKNSGQTLTKRPLIDSESSQSSSA